MVGKMRYLGCKIVIHPPLIFEFAPETLSSNIGEDWGAYWRGGGNYFFSNRGLTIASRPRSL